MFDRIIPSRQRIGLVINYGPLGFIRAITEEVGYDHLCVNTGHVTLCQHSEVELVLSLQRDNRHEHHRIAATVSHCDQHGTATLTFCQCAKETLQALLPFVTRH